MRTEGSNGTSSAALFGSATHRTLRSFGFDVVRQRYQELEYTPDFRDDKTKIIRRVSPWDHDKSQRGIYALIQAVRFGMAAIARTLFQMQDSERDLYLFDTSTRL